MARLNGIDLTALAAQVSDDDPDMRNAAAQIRIDVTKDANKRPVILVVAAHIDVGQGGVAVGSGIAHVVNIRIA